MRSDRERLQDILQAMDRIEQFAIGGKLNFEENRLIQSDVLYQILIIGEAVGDLSSSLQQQYPDIPWREIVGMRNIIAHQYFRIDLEVVWLVVDRELPQMRPQFEMMLEGIEEE